MRGRTDKGDAAEPGAEHHGNGPPQVVPGGGVVASPVRHVRATARESGPAQENQRSVFQIMEALRTLRGLYKSDKHHAMQSWQMLVPL